ncbi:hypothetical protein [Leucothrix arctica]|uniref:Uncharacterized protein n=1 Tax=Leucothrix arctica TaxID=1481894 RepID=A0A317CET0_9GAMM|nr:hypothetical protein [Leucothrix arctica]PWQ94632.1 hypothetical protein DKT75_15165 [Leucothrix arctica]
MPVRKKSKIERLLSFNQYRKRKGASKASQDTSTINYDELKSKIVNADELIYTHGSSKNLEEHLANLLNEFAGQSELLYYHAKLIVLIRREYKTSSQFKAFQELWEREKDFLIKHLNTRWLVSAADTFTDFSSDANERALSLSISLLVNTIKLNETERYLQHAESLTDDEMRKEALQNGRIALFDGTSALAVGTDDTLRNMRWRLDDICENDTISGAILQEIFLRLQSEETVYKRFRTRHVRQKTAWW